MRRTRDLIIIREICVKLIKKIDYYGNLDEWKISDKELFWKTVRPFLSDKMV